MIIRAEVKAIRFGVFFCRDLTERLPVQRCWNRRNKSSPPSSGACGAYPADSQDSLESRLVKLWVPTESIEQARAD